MSNNIIIKPFVFDDITEADWMAINAIHNASRQETDPIMPPRSVAETKMTFATIPSFVDFTMWGAWDSETDQLIGLSNCVMLNEEAGHNQHLAQMDLDVLASHRRQGVGKRLMSAVVERAVSNNRRLVIANTNTKVPAGEAFMQKCGATVGTVGITNQLEMAELDRDLMQQWIAQAEERASDYSLVAVDGAYPDEILEAVAEIKRVMNTAPTDDLEIEDLDFSAEQFRQMQTQMLSQGIEIWTLIAKHDPTGRFAGYTEIFFRPSTPNLAQQNDTAVSPDHRRKGLGRWLKAAMIERVSAEKPNIEYVRTGNADSNAPMLAINHAMGFKPYATGKVWQVPIETAQAYLKA